MTNDFAQGLQQFFFEQNLIPKTVFWITLSDNLSAEIIHAIKEKAKQENAQIVLLADTLQTFEKYDEILSHFLPDFKESIDLITGEGLALNLLALNQENLDENSINHTNCHCLCSV